MRNSQTTEFRDGWRNSPVPRIHFQLQLAELKDKLLAMAALAQQAVEASVDAYLQRDAKPVSYTHLTLPTNREV